MWNATYKSRAIARKPNGRSNGNPSETQRDSQGHRMGTQRGSDWNHEETSMGTQCAQNNTIHIDVVCKYGPPSVQVRAPFLVQVRAPVSSGPSTERHGKQRGTPMFRINAPSLNLIATAMGLAANRCSPKLSLIYIGCGHPFGSPPDMHSAPHSNEGISLQRRRKLCHGACACRNGSVISSPGLTPSQREGATGRRPTH